MHYPTYIFTKAITFTNFQVFLYSFRPLTESKQKVTFINTNGLSYAEVLFTEQARNLIFRMHEKY